MSDQPISPSPEEARRLLDDLWERILEEPLSRSVDNDLDSLVNSPFVSIRYCLPTQLLGKLIDPMLDCLCLQKGEGDRISSWDPRSFCSKTIVPWVAENQSVLGTSTDPYVSKPLRKPRIEKLPTNVRDTAPWALLYKVLSEVEKRNDATFSKNRFLETLRCIRNRMSRFVFDYPIPARVSLEQTLKIVGQFLAESSGGDRGLAIAAAIFECLEKFFGLYSSVKRQVVNAPDSARRAAADIECYGIDGALRLAVEVKERELTLVDVKSATNKARGVSLRELLFNVPGTKADDETEIRRFINRTWASGTNLYRLSVEELVKVTLVLTGEDGRTCFLSKVGEQLDTYNTQPANRKRWKELLEEL